MNCPKCGNPISPNMKFCAKCGTPVVNANVQQTANHVQSANQTPQPADIQSKKKEKKDKKGGKNIALKIVAIILVIAVLASGGLILADNIMYKNEKVEADEYITDFPVLKTKTEFMVYDAKKFPAESYRIKVERLKKTAGILKSEAFRSTEVLFNKTSTEQIYEIDFKENGEYRITLTDITVARTQSTTGSAETTTKKDEEGKKIVVDVKVDNESAEAADKVNLNSEKLDAFPVPKTPLEELEGTYKGSYFPGQGETGLTLTVYKEGEQHKAIFDFYNLPGRTNSKSGKYYMNVTYNEETKTYTFTSYEWIEKPSTYAFVNLEGTLNGDVLSGERPTKFSVTRVADDVAVDTQKPAEENVFEKIPSEFTFSSGAGAWQTTLTIKADGTFNGEYYDFNAGSGGTEYPNGTKNLCEFSGAFAEIKKVNEYTYTMTANSVQYAEPVGKEYAEDGMKITCTEPSGFLSPTEITLYLPGAPMSSLPQEVLEWCLMEAGYRSDVPQGMYILYNVQDKATFVSYGEDYFWRFYDYSKGDTSASLSLNALRDSSISLCPKIGNGANYFYFKWTDPNQRDFVATETNTGKQIKLHMEMNSDFSAITVTIESVNGYDLSAFGTSSDGKATLIFA